MDQRVQNAIARIEVASDGTVISQGTASLVGANLVLTALHVVAERGTNPLRFLPGEISLRFPNQLVHVTVHDWKWDADDDWALLTCTTQLPETIHPLPLAKIERDGDKWETHAFPDAKPDGLTVGGIVRNSHGNVQGRRAYQLLCDEAGAGQGLRVSGLSGAPVIVDKAVVGVMRWAMLTDERDEGGTLYACPASLIAVRCPEHFPEVRTVSPPPPATMTASRKWFAALATLALLLVAAYGWVSDRPPSDAEQNLPPKKEPALPPDQTGNAPPPDVAPPQGGKRGAAKRPDRPTPNDRKPPDAGSSNAPPPDPQVAIAKERLIRQLNHLQERKDVIVLGLDDLRQSQHARGFGGLRSDMASAEVRMMRSLSAADAEIERPNINLETVRLSLRDAENAIKTLEDFLNIG